MTTLSSDQVWRLVTLLVGEKLCHVNNITLLVGEKLCRVITLLVGEKLCRVNNLIKPHNPQEFERSTEILTTPSWSLWCSDTAHNNCAEIHLGGGDTMAFVVPSAAIAWLFSSTLVASTVIRRAHKDSDHTAVIAVVHWRLHTKTHRAGKVVSAVIISCLPFGRHC